MQCKFDIFTQFHNERIPTHFHFFYKFRSRCILDYFLLDLLIDCCCVKVRGINDSWQRSVTATAQNIKSKSDQFLGQNSDSEQPAQNLDEKNVKTKRKVFGAPSC